jgi:hypothetical protein
MFASKCVTSSVCQYDCGMAWLLDDYIHSDHVKRRKQLFSSPYASRCLLLPTAKGRERRRRRQVCERTRRVAINNNCPFCACCLINLHSWKGPGGKERHTYLHTSSKSTNNNLTHIVRLEETIERKSSKELFLPLYHGFISFN